MEGITGTLELGEEAGYLALADSTVPGEVQGVTGSDDRRMIAFTARPAGTSVDVRHRWRQTFPQFPVDAVFLPRKSEGTPWPDLLVIFRDGTLTHLRYAGQDTLHHLWSTLWQRLDLGTADRRLEAAGKLTPDQSHNWRRTALFGAVEAVLKTLESSTEEDRRRWVEAFPRIFRQEEDHRVLKTALDPLLQALRCELRRKNSSLSASFFEPVLAEIYRLQERANIEVRTQIDRVARSVALPSADVRADLRFLAERSRRNRHHIWQKLSSNDDPKPSTLIERSVMGLERWDSGFLLRDEVQLAPELDALAIHGVTVAGFVSPGPHAWLAAVSAGKLTVHALEPNLRVTLEPAAVYDLGAPGPAAISVVRNPEGDRLVLADGIGHLRLFRFHLSGDGSRLEEMDKLEIGGHGLPAALRCLSSDDAESLGVVACNQRRQATLVVFKVSGDRLLLDGTHSSPLPRVGCLDLAASDDGTYHLLTGSELGGPVELYRLEPGTIPELVDQYWLSGGGNLAVRFAVGLNPQHFIIGDRSGFLWRADMRPWSRVVRLAWTYRLGASIRSLLTISYGNEPHVLAGTDTGKMTLLRVADGTRIWTHRLHSPIRELTPAGPERRTLVATLTHRWLCTFEPVEDQDSVFGQVIKDLDDLAAKNREGTIRDLGKLWAPPDAQAARAIYELRQTTVHTAETVKEILDRVQVREHRARVIRYLVEKSPEILHRHSRELLPELSWREMQLLLNHLPHGERLRYDDVRRRLEDVGKGDKDHFPTEAVAAWVAFLQRVDHRPSCSVAEILAAAPSDPGWYKERWLRLELARLFLRALVRETENDLQPGESLLALALPHLLQLPESLLEDCQEVLPNNVTDYQDFENYCRVVKSLMASTSVPLPEAEHLAECLGSRGAGSFEVSLIRNFFQMIVAHHRFQDDPEGEWPESRAEILETIRKFAHLVYGTDDRPTPVAHLLSSSFLALLPSDPLPQDTASHETRMEWLKTAHARLVGKVTPSMTDGVPLSFPIPSSFEALRRLLLEVVDWETKHVQEEVRPFVELSSPLKTDSHGRLQLRLSLRPEGQRWLEDVSVRVDAGGVQGLQPPGQLYEIRHFPHFHDTDPAVQLTLSGFVPVDGGYLAVRTTLEAPYYRHYQVWEFPLPARRDVSTGFPIKVQPLAHALARTLDEVLACESAVVLAAVDPVLGRDVFVERWLIRTNGFHVDFDTALRDKGEGRKYSRRRLDLELLRTTLTLEKAGTRPVLVAPTNEFVQRLLEGEAPGLLSAWVAWLRERAASGASPRLVVVASAAHAAHLRVCDLGGIREIHAHRPDFLFNPDPSWDDPFWQALIHALQSSVPLEEDRLRRWVEDLGGDLHLVAEWLLWAGRSPDPARLSLADFRLHGPVTERLHAELGNLESIDLLNTLVGAEAVTQMPFSKVVSGLVAATDYVSTTIRQRPKPLQEAGTPFTDRSLQALRSDAHLRVHLRVEGFGPAGGGSSEAPRTRLLALASTRPRKQQEGSFHRLAQLGIGSWRHGIFRVSEPYRGYLQSLYSKLYYVPLKERDGRVYGEILGEGRTPLETLPLIELVAARGKELEALMPGAERAELRVLQRLARLWRGDRDELQAVFQALYKPLPVFPPPSRRRRWDRALTDLPYSIRGVGQTIDESTGESYPVMYHFWIDAGDRVDQEALGRAIVRAADLRRIQQKEREQDDPGTNLQIPRQWLPKVVLTGPGADRLEPDSRRRFAVLRSTDYLRAVWQGEFAEALLRQTRIQMRLSAISPFQTSGPIPPGSRYFFGRDEELEFIYKTIRRNSILIVGSRRVGKTSLLNQVRAWAWQEPDLEPVYVDLQRAGTRGGFLRALEVGLHDPENPHEVRNLADPTLEEVATKILEQGRIPLFLFNEIDGLAADKTVLGDWRSLDEGRRARFVMTAYTTVGQLGDPDSPFFNWTSGTRYGRKAIALTELSPMAAGDLLGLLTGAELDLNWASDKDECEGRKRLLDRSYRIPWVLQSFGQLLVERMEEERRAELRLDDVEQVLAGEGDVVWRYIDDIRFETLGSRTSESAQRPGYLLVLFCLARELYFRGGRDAPIIDPDLADRSPLGDELGFTVGEAREIVKTTVSELLVGEEQQVVGRWFDQLSLERALPLLTLTLTLEADPLKTGRFGFLMHILPRELHRKYFDTDPSLDNLITETALSFWSLVR